MKKMMILLLTITLISCSNDENIEPDYTGFLEFRGQRINGEIDNQEFRWSLTDFNVQRGGGYSMGNGICSPDNPVRILRYYFTHKIHDELEQISIITPAVDTSDESDRTRVLGLGEKQIGSIYDDFYISYRKNDLLYKSNSNTIGTLEILKTEEFIGQDNSVYLLVWIKMDAVILETCGENSQKIELKNTYMLVSLFGHRFEK
ncbi:hypothetical protein [Marinifilum caeruleilacunae]|uniref:Lipoprotein n=1 Tax=Marinifilum caeruleilacunae TaxID=2499076 RepID=A0ABX1WUB3_9BACT|nr:hypothetical protein [Marinifilum caeruleilacunae]NOU59657.1 hypothetical protein [Marinifilum caeruleilacunae]